MEKGLISRRPASLFMQRTQKSLQNILPNKKNNHHVIMAFRGLSSLIPSVINHMSARWEVNVQSLHEWKQWGWSSCEKQQSKGFRFTLRGIFWGLDIHRTPRWLRQQTYSRTLPILAPTDINQQISCGHVLYMLTQNSLVLIQDTWRTLLCCFFNQDLNITDLSDWIGQVSGIFEVSRHIKSFFWTDSW